MILPAFSILCRNPLIEAWLMDMWGRDFSVVAPGLWNSVFGPFLDFDLGSLVEQNCSNMFQYRGWLNLCFLGKGKGMGTYAPGQHFNICLPLNHFEWSISVLFKWWVTTIFPKGGGPRNYCPPPSQQVQCHRHFGVCARNPEGLERPAVTSMGIPEVKNNSVARLELTSCFHSIFPNIPSTPQVRHMPLSAHGAVIAVALPGSLPHRKPW